MTEIQRMKNPGTFWKICCSHRRDSPAVWRELAQFYDITVFPVHFICIFGFHSQSASAELDRVMMQVLRHSIDELNPSCWGSFLAMEYANHLLVLVFNRSCQEAQEAMESIAEVFRSISGRYLDTELYLGFSRIHESHDEIKMSYDEAMKQQ